MITWRCAPFDELTPRELHDILQARSAAFVVEQNCVFQDIDGADPLCWHVMGFDAPGAPAGDALGPRLRGGDEARGRLRGGDEARGRLRGGDEAPGRLVACARLCPPGTKFAEPSIGRVVTTDAVRGTGCGRALMREAIAQAGKLWPRQAIRIGAQLHLEKFYGSLGFVTASAPYDEDGIAHIEMVRPVSMVPDASAQGVGQ